MKIELTEAQLMTLFCCIGARQKNLREQYKNNEKNNRTGLMEKTLQKLRETEELEKCINYQVIAAAEFFENE